MSKNDDENTSFIIRRIPRDLWGKVRDKAYGEGLSIRDYILKTLKKETAPWQKTETGK